MEARTWNRTVVINEIVHLAANSRPDLMGENSMRLRNPELLKAAEDIFGGWDAALAHALHSAVNNKRRAKRWEETGLERRPPAPRQPHPDAMRPVYVATREGYVVQVKGESFKASEMLAEPEPLNTWHELYGGPNFLRDLGPIQQLFAVSGEGCGFCYNGSWVPAAEHGGGARRLGEEANVQSWVGLFDHRQLQLRDLFVHATASGKVKCAQVSQLPAFPEENGSQLFGVEPEDRVAGTWISMINDTLLLAASNGYAVTLALRELKPTGLKSSGIRGIQLRKGANLVDGVLASHGLEIAVVTAKGYAKRVLSDELRPQSPGGLGNLLIKMDDDDALVAVMPSNASTDVVFMTCQGRALRLPMPVIPVRPRSAMGQQVIKLHEGERICGAFRMLPMAFDDHSPMAFEV